ncbi:pyruvate kinase [bacterium]|nr:pyruvate kinase [bacterium]
MAGTKIVCTIGPASSSDEQMRALIRAGMNVARLNFSHGSRDTHRDWVRRLRRVAAEENSPLCIMQDLSGPKVRIGKFAEGRVFLSPGQRFILTDEEIIGDEQRVHVDIEDLPGLASGCERLMLADGMIELRVLSVSGREVTTEVVVGGYLSDRKGIAFPGLALPIDPLTEKDIEDLAVGIEMDVDYIALSFVRGRHDMEELRRRVQAAGSRAGLIAKLERPEALKDLHGILEASDGVMVARGDLGIEMAPEEVPLAQKRIIREATRIGRYVITATQMLESMIHNSWPTRAEASDVANAVLDGTDAVMLSGETATGDNPVRVVEMMRRIIVATEGSSELGRTERRREIANEGSEYLAIAWAAVEMAEMTGAKALVAYTEGGNTARLLSKRRPRVPVIGMSQHEKVLHQINLGRSVVPELVRDVQGFDSLIRVVDSRVRELGLAEVGDKIVIVAGLQVGVEWKTNVIKLHRVGSLE